MKQFGFIGMGNMGYAILKGLLKTVAPDQLIFSARNKAHMEQVAAETGVSYAADNVSCESTGPLWKEMPHCPGYAEYSGSGWRRHDGCLL